ncbi:MAG: hypothetical protein NC121_11305 [Blautia sp.]|nr:hypothetical protein [Blautia sp.]
MTILRTEVQGMKRDLTEVKQKVSRTGVIIENEIRANIQRVAEGHHGKPWNITGSADRQRCFICRILTASCPPAG